MGGAGSRADDDAGVNSNNSVNLVPALTDGIFREALEKTFRELQDSHEREVVDLRVQIRSLKAELGKQDRQAQSPEAGAVPLHSSASGSSAKLEDSSAGANAPDVGISRFRQRLRDLVSWPGFETAIACVIVANAVTMGFETSYHIAGRDTSVIQRLETCFVFLYAFELLLRVVAWGCAAFQSNWVKLDAVLVVLGSTHIAIDLIARGGLSWVKKILIARLLRLARLARLVRLLVRFKTLWTLVHGLQNCFGTLFWTLTIMVTLIYSWALVGLEVIVEDEHASEAYNDTVRANFNNLAAAMLTLVQGLTFDSMGSIYRPIIMERPVLMLYFVSFILVCSIALMNLVTAIMVENSLNQAAEDKDANKFWEQQKNKLLIEEIHKCFEELDTDGSGMLELSELREADEQVWEKLRNLCGSSDVEGVFAVLDYDNSQRVPLEDFCRGLLQIQEGKPIEFFRIIKTCADINQTTRQIQRMLQGASGRIDTPDASFAASRDSKRTVGQSDGKLDFTL